MLHLKCFVKHQLAGFRCPAYALLSYGVASRGQEKETLKLKTVEDTV